MFPSFLPSFFDRAQRKDTVVTFPDRLTTVKNWIADGGGLLMLGGWLSFSGAFGKGGWGRSSFSNALPVQCLATEDLVESSAGFTAELVVPGHPAVKGLSWDTFPPIFGYNEVTAETRRGSAGTGERNRPPAGCGGRIRQGPHPYLYVRSRAALGV